MIIALKCVLLSAIGVICSWLGYRGMYKSLSIRDQLRIDKNDPTYNPPLGIRIAAFALIISVPIFIISLIILVLTL